MDGGVAEVDALLFEGCECIIAYAVEDELLPGFLHAKVLGITVLRILVIRDDLFSLSGADACFKCHLCVCSRVCWCYLCPSVVGDDHRVLILWDDALEIAVALALVEMVGFQDREYPPDFILEVVDDFGRDDVCNLHDGALLGSKDLVCSILCFARHDAFAFGGWMSAVA